MEDSFNDDSNEHISGDGSGPISRSSVTHVAYIVGKFNDIKRDLVREIGFAGILDLPQITKVDRKFTLWLLSKVDLDKRSIIVNGECVVDVIDFEAARIMGIPCGRREVCPLDSGDKKKKLAFVDNLVGSSDTDNNILTAAEKIVTAQEDPALPMTLKDKQNFKVAFVVWVMGFLLAPRKKYNAVSDRFWGALLVPEEIKQFNWARYVIDEIFIAARDVQHAMHNNKPVNTISGCSILIQIMYFESINMGSLNRPRGIKPRVKAYDTKSLSLMIAADKACSASGSANATWGSSVRGLPRAQNPSVQLQTQSYNDRNNINSDTDDTVIHDLGKYFRQNFGDKLSVPQSVAFSWFDARCALHMKQLRSSIQKDTIELVRRLFKTADVPIPAISLEPFFSASKARPALSEPSRPATYSKSALKNKRGYESSTSPFKRRCGKKAHVSFREHNLPETLLSGTSVSDEHEVEDEQSVTARHSTTATLSSGFSINVPSFDLGIDFDWEAGADTGCNAIKGKQGDDPALEARSGLSITPDLPVVSPADKITMVSIASVDDASNISMSKIHDECAGTSTPGCFKPLRGTPPSAKSVHPPEFTSPDQKFINCKTSPASLSKILAEAELIDRMSDSEHGGNVKIKPWDDGYSEEPIKKRIVGRPNIPESPWSYNLCHRKPPIDIVEKLYDEVSLSNCSAQNRCWLSHTSPRHIELDGIWIRKCFIPEIGLTYDVCDLAIRRLKQLDEIMYSDTPARNWRHILESEFAIFALTGETAYNRKAIIEQFVGPSVRYRLEDCRMIVVPTSILLNWCSYFFDFKESCVHVIDPLYNEYQSDVFKQIHHPNISKVAAALMNCFDVFFENWHSNLQEWPVHYVVPPIVHATSIESGLLNLMYIRQFDGSKFQLVNMEYFKYFKMAMLYELMSLSENRVKPPVNITITIDD